MSALDSDHFRQVSLYYDIPQFAARGYEANVYVCVDHVTFIVVYVCHVTFIVVYVCVM